MSHPPVSLPDAESDPLPAPVFYRLDNRRVTLREFFFESWSPLALIGWTVSKLGVRFPSSTDDLPVESLLPFETPADSLPLEVQTEVAEGVRKLEALGFHDPIYHVVNDTLHQTLTALATLRHASGRVIGRVHLRLWRIKAPARKKSFVEFITPLKGAAWLWSLSGKPDMLAPAGCTVNRLPRADVAALWDSHQRALQAMEHSVETVGGVDAMAAEVEHLHATLRDFHLARGVFAPLSEQEAQVQRRQVQVAAASPGDADQAAVLTELQLLVAANQRPKWINGLVILGLSLLLFVGAGAAKWSWDFVAMLVAVLFVHELGHFAAMKMLGYQNVAMFFIPLFGAAVKGTHHHAPGWKKAIVSLAGPILGTAVGVVLGIVGIVTDTEVLIDTAVISMILNGLNLLPVLPLDGGWLMHTLLFSRHVVLDIGFRVLAAAALLGGGAASGDKLLMGLGVFMLLGIPLAAKLGRISDTLRREGLGRDLEPPPQPGAGINLDIASHIAQRVRAAFTTGLTHKLAAQHTLSVYETLHTRPPGIFTTVVLLLLTGATVGVTVLAGSVFIVAQNGGLAALLHPAPGPTHPVTPAAIVTTAGPAATASQADSHEVLVVTLEDDAKALAAQAQVAAALPPQASLTLLGRSLLVSVPMGDTGARQAAEQALAAHGTPLVQSKDAPLWVTLSCNASSLEAAVALQEEIAFYLDYGPTMLLLPPWLPADQLDADQRARHSRGRALFRQLSKVHWEAVEDKQLDDLRRQMIEQTIKGENQNAEALRKQQEELATKMALEKLEAFAAQRPADDLTPLVDRYLALLRESGPYAVHQRGQELGPWLGQVELVDGKPAPAADRWTVWNGSAWNTVAQLQLEYMTFASLGDGLPQVLRWLESQGCGQFQYRIEPVVESED